MNKALGAGVLAGIAVFSAAMIETTVPAAAFRLIPDPLLPSCNEYATDEGVPLQFSGGGGVFPNNSCYPAATYPLKSHPISSTAFLVSGAINTCIFNVYGSTLMRGSCSPNAKHGSAGRRRDASAAAGD